MQTPVRRLIPTIGLLLCTASPDAQRSAQPDAAAQTQVTAPTTRRATGGAVLRRRAVRGRTLPGAPVTETVTPTVFEQQPDQPPGQVKHEPREQRMQRGGSFDGDLRSLIDAGPVKRRERPERAEPRPRPVQLPGDPVPSGIDTPVRANAPAPAPLTSFDGLDRANWGAGHPPDTNGDVGPAYYIQSINTSIGIYDKATGLRVAAFTFDTFMSQGAFGNLCDTENFGDPVVLYDTFEDRWILTDFAFRLDASSNVVNPPGVFECFAVSKTGDPVAGGWNFYSINTTGGLGDYPKLGVWPDGIYMSVNMFNYAATGGFQNVRVYALNKAQMYAGAPSVQVVEFNLPAGEFSLLPANARLQTGTPPPGSPNYFTSVWRFLNVVGVWKLHADWNNLAASSFTGPFNSTTATNWSQLVDTTVQPPGGNQLDTLFPRLMMQNQYTNIGGVESLWNSHTVGNSGDFSNTAGVRYYQVQVTGGTVAANATQASTYSPDTLTHRFMPSVAVDRAGNMAIGYTATSTNLFPSILYAGRLATDPVNVITQTETMLMTGTGNQNGSCGGSPCSRWGDYSAMTLDPDGCTFWYTNQYYQTHDLNYRTRIGSFAFPSCIAAGGEGTLQGTVTNASLVPIAGATVTLGSRTATTDAGGNYSFDLPAGTYPGATATVPGYFPATSSPITITSGATTTRDFVLNAAPTSACLTDTTQADFQAGAATNCDLTGSADNVRLLASLSSIDQQNNTIAPNGAGLTAAGWAGQTFTPAVTGKLTRVDVDLFCGDCVSTMPDIRVSIRATTATSPQVPTGPDLAVATIPGFIDGVGGFFPAHFASPATLTAGNRYAVVIRPVANSIFGQYFYGLSNASVYANGQAVTSTNSGVSWSASWGTRDLGFITYMQSGFAPSGTFESSLKDANPAIGATPTWDTLSWNATVPAGTTLRFQAAASNNSSGPFTFVGPDGTPATFFTGGASLAQFNGNRYLKYRATLTTSNSTVTPAIHDVTVCFNNVGSTTASLSTNAVTFAGKRLVATTSPPAPPVSFTNNGPGPVTFTSFNGAAPAASFTVGADFAATTNCPLPPAELASGGSCQFVVSFSPTAAGNRSAALTIATNASNSPHGVALSGVGFVIDDATVTATIASAATRLQQLQNSDGGWYFGAAATSCGVNAFQGGSCNNIIGVTGLGLLSAHDRTGDASMLADAVQAGQLLQAIHNASPTQQPFSQDLEFLRALSDASADPQYAALASSWFTTVTNTHPIAADRVDWQFANRGLVAVWDVASLIRSAKAAGRADYAQALGNRVIALEPGWRGVNANLTLIGMGSLLWAIHDLPGFDTTISDYRAYLLAQQAPAGTWSGGNLQTTAYVALGLGAVGGDTAAAIEAAVAYFIGNQLTNGGWPFSIVDGVPGDEFSSVDSEVARAIDLLFSTGVGSTVTVSPAQLASVTFDAVSVAGTTTIIATTSPQGVKTPPSYTLVEGLTYQVTTTAAVGGGIVMCISVPWDAVAGRFDQVRLLQPRNGRWMDVTVLKGPFAPDASRQRVCGGLSSLSPVSVALRK
jgi:hypothetical protein